MLLLLFRVAAMLDDGNVSTSLTFVDHREAEHALDCTLKGMYWPKDMIKEAHVETRCDIHGWQHTNIAGMCTVCMDEYHKQCF